MPPPGVARTETMDDGLTVRQREIMDKIVASYAERHMPPTWRELMQMTGIKSPNGVRCHLDALKRKGYIDWDETIARSLKILKGGPSACTHCGGTGREPESSP